MSVLVKVLTGAAGLAAVVGFASPAAAQYYPAPGYGYGNSGGVVGAIVNSVLGGGQQYGYAQPYGYGQQYGAYGYNQGNTQYATSQCSRAVQARLGGGYNYGGRVLGVTSVERRNNGVRVRGIASSGNQSGYGYNNAGADLSFSCRVNYRGQITDVDLNRRAVAYNNGYYRGY